MSEQSHQPLDQYHSALQDFATAYNGDVKPDSRFYFDRDRDPYHRQSNLFQHGDADGNLGVDYVGTFVGDTGEGVFTGDRSIVRDTEGSSQEVHDVNYTKKWMIDDPHQELYSLTTDIAHTGSTDNVITSYEATPHEDGDKVRVKKTSSTYGEGEYDTTLTGKRAERAKAILLGRATRIVAGHTKSIQDFKKNKGKDYPGFFA